jgi:hypothetical protein
LNVGGKVLEKLLIERINRHVFSNSLLNENQYGFRPQKSTTDAALAVKEFALDSLRRNKCVILVSLDVKGGFRCCMVAKCTKQLAQHSLPQKPLPSDSQLLLRQGSKPPSKHAHGEESSDEGLLPGIMLRSWVLEHYVQHTAKPRLLKPHEGNSIRGRSCNHDFR